MRKLLTLLFILIITTSSKLAAQTYPSPVTDTTSYLRYIVSNKQQFIGQPFSVLKDSLKIDIKYFSGGGFYHHDQRIETNTEFGFNYGVDMEDFYLTYPSLRVTWQHTLNLVEAREIERIIYNTGVGWGPRAYQHYQTAIIKDIKLVQ